MYLHYFSCFILVYLLAFCVPACMLADLLFFSLQLLTWTFVSCCIVCVCFIVFDSWLLVCLLAWIADLLFFSLQLLFSPFCTLRHNLCLHYFSCLLVYLLACLCACFLIHCFQFVIASLTICALMHFMCLHCFSCWFVCLLVCWFVVFSLKLPVEPFVLCCIICVCIAC